MSGDVQPRKRKDKKKKKDDLGVEEPRGTAAALGEGDVFMHSQSEHGTGGHWCAKVIFFSLLAVLITLVGLIILENRGLTELEANSVESRYSGVLEGWIEDAPDDDHHDEHTLELKHHDDEDDADHSNELEHDDEDHDDVDEDDEHENDDDEDENDDDDENDNDNEESEKEADDSEEADNADDDEDEESEENEDQNLDAAKDENDIEEPSYRNYYHRSEKANDNDDDDDLQQEESDEQQESAENRQDEDEDDNEDVDDDDHDEKDNNVEQNFISFDQNVNEKYKAFDNYDDDADEFLQNDVAHEDEEEHEEEPTNVEIETIEREVSDEDAVSTEDLAPKDDDQSQDESEELSPNKDDSSVEDDDVEFLEPDELDELPIVEPITAPKGKPLAEVGESPSTERPQDTLADEEEYERQQEQLRKEKEQASQGMWLKFTVGGALLVATHAVLRRATASRETDTEEDEQDFREETPISDRRMTLITEPVPPPTVAPKVPEVSRPIEREVKRESTVIVQSPPAKEDDEEEEIIVSKPTLPVETPDTVDRELYSDEEDIDIEEEEEDEEEIIKPTKAISQQAVPQTPHNIPDVTKEVTPEPDDDDDVEIIDEEQLEEEMEEEEISDVDDAELLSRLEEKYGRLPEPDRPTQKDGGNSFEDEWPGEPEDAFWSEHLEQAQRELRQEWLD